MSKKRRNDGANDPVAPAQGKEHQRGVEPRIPAPVARAVVLWAYERWKGRSLPREEDLAGYLAEAYEVLAPDCPDAAEPAPAIAHDWVRRFFQDPDEEREEFARTALAALYLEDAPEEAPEEVEAKA